MNWIQPVKPVKSDGTVQRVGEVHLRRVERETEDETAERRRKEEQERQKQAAAQGVAIPADPDKPAIIRAEDAEDGHTHVDFRV